MGGWEFAADGFCVFWATQVGWGDGAASADGVRAGAAFGADGARGGSDRASGRAGVSRGVVRERAHRADRRALRSGRACVRRGEERVVVGVSGCRESRRSRARPGSSRERAQFLGSRVARRRGSPEFSGGSSRLRALHARRVRRRHWAALGYGWSESEHLGQLSFASRGHGRRLCGVRTAVAHRDRSGDVDRYGAAAALGQLVPAVPESLGGRPGFRRRRLPLCYGRRRRELQLR
jgi:hypothetical protein